MAIIPTKGLGIEYMWAAPGSTGPTLNLTTLNSADDQIATILQIPYDNLLITRVGFRYGAGTGTPPTYRLSLQSVDGSGNPTGTILASTTFTPPADTTWNGTWRWLNVLYATTQGEILAIVIDYSSGTISGVNNSSFTEGIGNMSFATGFPYESHNLNATGWLKQGATFPCMALDCHTADANLTPYILGYPIQSLFATDLSAANTRQALSFDLTGVFTTTKVVGFRFLGKMAAGGSVKIVEPSGSTFTVDTDWLNGGGSSYSYYQIYLQNPVTLFTGGFNHWKIGIEYVDVAVGMRGITLASSTDAQAFYGEWYSQVAHLATYSGGVWTEDYTTKLFASLIIDGAT